MTMAEGEEGKAAPPAVWVTRSGLPLSIQLEWPFHRSGSGADFHVLHGRVELENSGGLHALVALQLTVTVREVLPSLERKDAEAPALNVLRKEVDNREIELLKTPKRVPVAFNSRMYDFKRNKWAFGEATEEDVGVLLERKVYWQTRLRGAAEVWLADPVDGLYLDAPVERLKQAAGRMAQAGLISLEGEYGRALPGLMARGEKIEGAMKRALAEMEKKHAFERG
jgi:hypothetical protein